MTTPKFTTNAIASQLLNAATASALKDFEGEKATHQVLDSFADKIRAHVLVQAELGEWAPLGVRAATQLLGLRVTARVDRSITARVPVRVEYDFTRTDLSTLVVEMQPRGKQ